MIGEKYPYRTGSRLLMIPVALVVGVIVGLLWAWEAGVLIGVLLIILGPELFTIFFKRMRQPLQEDENEKALDKKSKSRRCLREGKDDGYDDGFVPPMLFSGNK